MLHAGAGRSVLIPNQPFLEGSVVLTNWHDFRPDLPFAGFTVAGQCRILTGLPKLCPTSIRAQPRESARAEAESGLATS